MRTTPDDLRRAANVPAYWDLAPLLNDAAKQLEQQQQHQDEPRSEQLIIAATAGAIYATGKFNVAAAVARARELAREVRRTEPKDMPAAQSEVAESVVGV